MHAKEAADARCREWQRASDAADALTAATTAADEAAATHADLLVSLQRANADNEAANAEVATARVRVDEAIRALTLLERSARLVEHRARLVENEPCPLCGALEHPSANLGALDSVIDQQQQVVDELRAALRDAELLAKTASESAATLQGRLQQSSNDVAKRITARDDADDALRIATRALGDDGLGSAALAVGLSAAKLAQQTAAELVTHCDRALAAARAATEAVLQARNALDSVVASIRETETELAELATELATLLQQRAGRDARASSAAQQISRALADAGHVVDGEFANLAIRVDAWRTDAASASGNLAILESAIATWQRTLQNCTTRASAAAAVVATLTLQASAAVATTDASAAAWHAALAASGFAEPDALRLFALDDAWAAAQRAALDRLDAECAATTVLVTERERMLAEHRGRAPDATLGDLNAALQVAIAATATAGGNVELARGAVGDLKARLAADDQAAQHVADEKRALDQHRDEARPWLMLQDMIGSENGNRFRVFAQGLTLDRLLVSANRHLDEFAPRYRLERVRDNKNPLEVQVVDRDLGDDVRSVASLSGGEGFLVSLALALGLSSMSSRNVRIGTLLIDEGFGTLDPVSLETALAALDALQSRGRQVGIISHVPGLIERLSAYVEIRPLGGSRSEVVVHGARTS